MSYTEAIEHLHTLGLELAPDSSTTPRRKFELDHMRTLARALGDPQLQFPSVLIAGTNGKGSTAATLASILAAAGYRTGLYTSPHLSRVTERIRTNCPRVSSHQPVTANQPQPTFTEIPEDDFGLLYFHIDDVARLLVATEELPHAPSFFETLTALAFVYFAQCKLDIVILEVGLGGRLDATNIVEPILSVITDIALDHQDYLGATIAAITREKAGILRTNGTLITLPQHPEANQAIGEIALPLNIHAISAADFIPARGSILNAAATPGVAAGFSPWDNSQVNDGALAPGSSSPPQEPGAPFMTVSPSWVGSNPILPPNHYDLTLNGEPLHIRSPLLGEHQQRNIALAIATAIELRNPTGYNLDNPIQVRNQKRYNIPNAAIEAGIAATNWPGRLEFIAPNLLLDVAHNPAGAWTLRAAIAALPEAQPRTLIFSCLRDKDLNEMAQILFPLFDSTGGRPHDHIILAPIDNPRAASLEDLLAAAQRLDAPAHAAHTPAEALALAQTLTPAGGLILATGSIYLVGALRELATPAQPTHAVHLQ
jgi:dihydrofolate synthase/folylpolyglutamate synthase